MTERESLDLNELASIEELEEKVTPGSPVPSWTETKANEVTYDRKEAFGFE